MQQHYVNVAMRESGRAQRTAQVTRQTKETTVSVEFNLDGSGSFDNATGVGFLDHMLDLFAKHGQFDLTVRCSGDLHVDEHHSVEDVGIVLGQACREALGNKAHIVRYGHAYVPMDESLARAVIDLSGRFALHFDADFGTPRVGDLSTELVQHFWHSFAEHAQCALHISVIHGSNTHHKIEAVFKAVGRALGTASGRSDALPAMPSTKGTL